MTYIEGFVVPVPKANREAYRKQAADAAPMFHEFGVQRHVEAWARDVPVGKVTDFRMAVNATDDEDVVFSWFEYASKEARDAANEKIMTDPRMKELGANMPFDGKRMVFGGFEAIVEEGGERGAFIDGFVTPVRLDKLDAYRTLAQSAAGFFKEHGALRDVEAIADDVPKGEVTDFYRAVKSEDGETLFFSFIEWPSKQARDEGWTMVMEDERMQPQGELPFEGRRLIWGGFEPIVDSVAREAAHA
jgi:uncharacterized protein YbaA (DUF1428 family)